MRVSPTQYSIQAHGSPRNGSHLRSWVLEGSIDGSSWTELDRRTNNDDLNGANLIQAFSISKSIEYRFIRLRQTGKNHEGNDMLAFYHFEAFGFLVEFAAAGTLSVAPIRSVSPSVPSLTSSVVVAEDSETDIAIGSLPLTPSTSPSVPVLSSTNIVANMSETQITLNSFRPLDGILSHLSRKYGGNVHDKGIVTITSSSIYGDDPQYSPTNLAGPSSLYCDDPYGFAPNQHFSSNDAVNQWVQWDFHDMRVNPTEYCIQSHGSARNGSHLRSWVIEGSIDGLTWTAVDRRTNNDDLNGESLIGAFSVRKSSEYRFLRLRQTGRNHSNDHTLAFYHFEVFGNLRGFHATTPSLLDRLRTVFTFVPVDGSSEVVNGTVTEITRRSVNQFMANILFIGFAFFLVYCVLF
jgi:hypothetical protein